MVCADHAGEGKFVLARQASADPHVSERRGKRTRIETRRGRTRGKGEGREGCKGKFGVEREGS